VRRLTGSSTILFQAKLLRSKGVNNNLGLQVPNLNALISSGTQPVSVGGEDKGMDDFSSIEGVQTLALVQVPKHGGSILSSRGTETAIGGDAHSVKVSRMSNKIISELAISQGPNLDKAIPSTGNNEGNRLARAESNAGNPFRVTLGISTNGVLALSKSVPKLDGLITGSTDNLTVIHAEGNRKDIL